MAAILVKIGDLELTAVLANCRTISAVHTKVFEKICQRFSGYKPFAKRKNIVDMIVTVSGFPVALKMRIVSNLYVDMALGLDFLDQSESIMFSRGLFTWYWYGRKVETQMLDSKKSRRPISSGGREDPNVIYIDLKHQIGNSGSEPEDDDETSNAASPMSFNVSATTKDANTTKKNSFSNQDSNKAASGTGNISKSQKNPSIKWRKVFVATTFWVGLLDGDVSAYYGVYWGPKNEKNRFNGEFLERKEKSSVGFTFEALTYVFETAQSMGIRNLHVLMEDGDAMRCMEDYQECDSDDRDDVMSCPRGLYYPQDVINYSVVCMTSDILDNIKYEFVSSDDTTHREMVIVRKGLEKYMDKNPV